MSSHIFTTPIDPWQQIQAHQEAQRMAAQYGATASFIGTMRDFSDKPNVNKMVLEHYPAMTQHYLAKLEQQAYEQWPLQDCLIIHRVGDIYPGEAIVVIACWSAHRRAALDACDWLIETLKHQAPFWKKESTPAGQFWVESNTDGY